MITLLIASAMACPPSQLPYLSIEQGSACLSFPQDQNPETTGGTDFGYYYGQYGEIPDSENHWVTRMALEIENICAESVTLREPGCTSCIFDIDITPGATVVVDVPEPPELDEVAYVLTVTEGTGVVDITVTAVGGQTVPCGTADTGGSGSDDTSDTGTGTTNATTDTGGSTDTAAESGGCGCAETTTRVGSMWSLGLLQRRSSVSRGWPL